MSTENPYREMAMQEQPKEQKSLLLRWFTIGSVVFHIATVIPLIYCLVEIQTLKSTHRADLTTPARPNQLDFENLMVADNITNRLDNLGFDLHQVIKKDG